MSRVAWDQASSGGKKWSRRWKGKSSKKIGAWCQAMSYFVMAAPKPWFKWWRKMLHKRQEFSPFDPKCIFIKKTNKDNLPSAFSVVFYVFCGVWIWRPRLINIIKRLKLTAYLNPLGFSCYVGLFFFEDPELPKASKKSPSKIAKFREQRTRFFPDPLKRCRC